MHRFYLPEPGIQNGVLAIKDPRLTFQMERVLRFRKGEKFSVFGSDGKEWLCEALAVSRKEVLANVVEPVERHAEPALKVTLFQAVPKKIALFEWVVEKAVELGVEEIVPLITERTEHRRLPKMPRLQMIAVEAAEQSGRTHIPLIHTPMTFEEAVVRSQNGFLAYECEAKTAFASLRPGLKKSGSLELFIGPEGGFSQKEVGLAQKSGLTTFSLGPRILRTETAAIASLSLFLL